MKESGNNTAMGNLADLRQPCYSLLDLLPEGTFSEKLVALALNGVPAGLAELPRIQLEAVRASLACDTSDLHLVVFGGGTGLSNILGGDSRRPGWKDEPFTGLKEFFPRINAIVCVTDDGGSTGELLKDLPLMALGDLRHVLLSSVRSALLQSAYGISQSEAHSLACALHAVFNYRFISEPLSASVLVRDTGVDFDALPPDLGLFLWRLVELLFTHTHLRPTLRRPQCLGNLLLAAAIYCCIDQKKSARLLPAEHEYLRTATIRGLTRVAKKIGAEPHAVLPCTTTPAQLQILYGNGVLVTSERKSAQAARGYPVDRVFVSYHRQPFLLPEVIQAIRRADILLYAPGSLYSSIIPIFQIPELVEEVRVSRALKLLISNIWVQKGETDAAREDPRRKYHVSDLLKAYDRNIPGGVAGLFSHVLGLHLGEIPGSVLQNYGLENKEPIFFDRHRINNLGFEPIAAAVFSGKKLRERMVIQHDPTAVAVAVRTLWSLHAQGLLTRGNPPPAKAHHTEPIPIQSGVMLASERYHILAEHLALLDVDMVAETTGHLVPLKGTRREDLQARVLEILWGHPDIIPEHLRLVRGITLIDPRQWQRSQIWDNVFSFYDPQDQRIKIRSDLLQIRVRFEMAILVALGQSLLGNYARSKTISMVRHNRRIVGRLYTLVLCDPLELQCFFSPAELDCYLRIARMQAAPREPGTYSRLINGEEGFTPPGLLFGLFFAWYLDNRFAPNIEYKMSIMRSETSDLIPEQIKIVERRRELIQFFRESVFHHGALPDQATLHG